MKQDKVGDIKKLIDLTIDTGRMDGIKDITLMDALEIEKEGLGKDLDSIKEVFYSDLISFYQNYTNEEIARMIKFYNSAPGSKLAADLKLFSADNFYVYKEWIKRVMYNKNPDITLPVKKPEAGASDAQKLIDLIGIPEYLSVKKEYTAMWQEPQHEAAFRKEFEKETPGLLAEIEYYFLAKYSTGEMRFLLDFYESSLGEKIKRNALKSNQAILDANNRWIENWEKVNHDKTFGKYQRKN